MAWTHLTFGTLLTQNRDGSQKQSPRFWTPERAQFSIPPLGQNHGRPCLRFHNDQDTHPLTLMFFPDRIGGLYGTDRRTLVALEDAPSAPDFWANPV